VQLISEYLRVGEWRSGFDGDRKIGKSWISRR
jgi:hypothetical protein